ncbi:hypothetical protein RRG08_066986 [Elysia crispata]|uniref:Uncharacterized protein n=1 Tax=Elysia crispata TaxID=231223 RepID=A0AAE0Z9N6_9GAST|nr:hypothetical protein RRG08_066986 [Elysia crispata]
MQDETVQNKASDAAREAGSSRLVKGFLNIKSPWAAQSVLMLTDHPGGDKHLTSELPKSSGSQPLRRQSTGRGTLSDRRGGSDRQTRELREADAGLGKTRGPGWKRTASVFATGGPALLSDQLKRRQQRLGHNNWPNHRSSQWGQTPLEKDIFTRGSLFLRLPWLELRPDVTDTETIHKLELLLLSPSRDKSS